MNSIHEYGLDNQSFFSINLNINTPDNGPIELHNITINKLTKVYMFMWFPKPK